MPEHEWTALGDQHEVTPRRLEHIAQRFEETYAYAVKSETHLWGVTLMHQATEQTLDALDGGGGQPLLDADTLLMRPTVGCYVCEQPYSDELEAAGCPGDPTGRTTASLRIPESRVSFSGVGRNDPCPCGSGAKYKRCHGAR